MNSLVNIHISFETVEVFYIASIQMRCKHTYYIDLPFILHDIHM